MRIAAVVAVLMGAAVWAIGGEVDEAGACTGWPGYLAILDADVILEGAVDSVVPTGETDLAFAYYDVTFAVARGYRGTSEGETVAAKARIPIPGQAVMCPQFPQDLAGKYVLLGLRADDTGSLQADAWIMLYMSDDVPSNGDPGYAGAVRAAELATDANPELPVLRATPGTASCGEPVTYEGARFGPGEYVLSTPGWRIIGVVQVGSSGTFTLTAPAMFFQCRLGQEFTFAGWIEVYPVVGGDNLMAVLGPLSELTYLAVRADGDLPELTPELRMSERKPFTCGAEVLVLGDGFEAELLTVRLEGSAGPVSVHVGTSPHTGSFSAGIKIPAEACHAPLAVISVYQAGYERFGRPLARIYVETRPTTPGAPNLGNTPPASSPIPWLQIAGLMALIVGAAAITARR
ncbi:MAG TPA: hypothetical protein PJ994_00400 [Tepidiformaceae bacterium]|nr:hypothetical protein [Tepidiformaceae bacterium]